MKRLLAFLFLIFFINPLWAQEAGADEGSGPSISIEIRGPLEYSRPARLQEEDADKNRTFRFKPGLEIITDVEYVKVLIRDEEKGRTPYESSSVPSGYLRITLEKPGYEELSFWVNVHPDKRTTVTIGYNDKSSRPSHTMESGIPLKSRQLYGEINPDDPSYYQQLYFMTEEDLDEVESILISRAGQSLVSLKPLTSPGGIVFQWDGKDAAGDEMPEGDYSLQFRGRGQHDFRINRNYSRRPLSYYSGFSGLALVPAAANLFPGAFQFGTSFAIDRVYEDDSHSYNLPFSFYFRLSPVKRWEAAAEVETSFINEYTRPSLRINSSHKFSLLTDTSVRLSLGLRGSYKSAISDFNELQGGTLIRDPGGFSFFIPLQLRHRLWDLYFSPEFLYSVRTLGTVSGDDEYDMTAVLRWGLSYGTEQFSAGLSSSLYLPSFREAQPVIQGALEVSYYFPESPMYMSLFGIYQKVFDDEDRSNSFGFNLGFLI